MTKNNLNFFKQYEMLNPFMFSEKHNPKKTLKKLCNYIWFEFLYKSIHMENMLFFKNKKKISFSVYLKNKNSFNSDKTCTEHLDQVINYNLIEIPQNFIIICIDEYINGRKQGSSVYKNDNKWSVKSWKKLENIFETIIFHLKSKKKENFLIFLLIESFRYDILCKIFFEDNKLEKRLKIIEKWVKHFFIKRHKSYLFELLKNSNEKKYYLTNGKRNKILINSDSTKFLDNFFYQKEKGITHKLNIFLFLKIKGALDLYYRFFQNLLSGGLINYNLFWSKNFSREFLFILKSITSGLFYEEMIFIFKKETNKCFIKLNSKMFIQIKDFQKWCETCNLTKIGFVFSINLLTTKFKNSYALVNFIYSLEYKRVNSWLKFLTGFSFSISQRWNFKFYQIFLSLIEKNWLSDYLRGGLLFGMGINVRNLFEYKELFIEKYFVALKSDFYIEESKCHMIKNGIYFGISLSNGVPIKVDLKENFLQMLMKNMTMNSKTGESSALSFGLCLQNDGSKYILRNLLKMMNLVQNEKMIRFLFFSFSLIYKNDKEIAEHLFEKLFISNNSVIRNGAICIYTLAFTGSFNRKVTEKILECISKDLDDNVKKTLVIGLGFVFFSKFFLLENIINQFTNHFNPFIRYGACFAIGISSFYNNSYKAIELLEKLSTDKIDFVRQGSFIALGLCTFRDQNQVRKNKVQLFFEKKLLDKTHTELSRFGVILGYSLTQININKNTKINSNGYAEKAKDITALFLFIQHWYWLPCILFIFLLI